MKADLNSMELITMNQASRLCYNDMKQLVGCYKLRSAVDENTATWYVLTNIWLLMINEYSHRTCVVARDYVLRNGLLAFIKVSDDCAEKIMHNTEDFTNEESSLWNYILQDVAEHPQAERIALTLLRFGKRLSPANAKGLEADSIQKFLDVNKSNKTFWKQKKYHFDCPTDNGSGHYLGDKWVYNNDPYLVYPFLWDDIKNEFAKLVPPVKLTESEVLKEGRFSNGSTFTGAKLPMVKLRTLSLVRRNLYNDFSYPLLPSDIIDKHFYMTENYADLKISKVMPVPKSYKASRIIAPEQVDRSFYMQGLREIWTQWIKQSGQSGFIDVEDQEPNQEWCRLASIDKRYATADLSHASDSIAMELGLKLNDVKQAGGDQLYGEPYLDWVEHFRRYSADHLLVDQKVIKSNIFLTSGAPCTFINESVTFLSIARAVSNYARIFVPDILEPRAFGDDVIIDARVLDAFVEILQRLGFEVNLSKTFGLETNYRESCGVEYLHGYPLHTVKWPRNTFVHLESAKPEDLGSLIQLQHKIFDLSWYAQRFLATYVRNQMPQMTSSRPYTDCDDLWEEFPKFGVTTAPCNLDCRQVLDNFVCQPVTTCVKDGIKCAVSVVNKVATNGPLTDALIREKHYVLTADYGSKVRPNDRNTDMWRYTTFLLKGPSYGSRLDKLLGVSSSYVKKDHVEKPSIRWEYKTIH